MLSLTKARNFLLKLLGFSGKSIFYIGGNDVLPPPLERDEEMRMLEEYAKGSMDARAVLIEHNLRLVVYIAKKFENAGVNVEDLISIGTIGSVSYTHLDVYKRQILHREPGRSGRVCRRDL